MKHTLILAIFILLYSSLTANDTVYFHLSSPYKTVKDPAGKYIRKAVLTKDSGWLALDYNDSNRLVMRCHYSDTSFRTRLGKLFVYNEGKGFCEQIRTYNNGKLESTVGFNNKGDTAWKQTFSNGRLTSVWTTPGYGPKEVTFIATEVDCNFPGGVRNWSNYLTQNLKYPKQAIKKEIQGEVRVLFIVASDGSVSDIEIIKSVHPLLDEEAMRLIKISPKWIPASWDGMKVAQYKVQPVVFRLE